MVWYLPAISFFLISLCIFRSVKRAFAAGEDGVFLAFTFMSVILIIGALCPRGGEHRGSILGCTSTTFNIETSLVYA